MPTCLGIDAPEPSVPTLCTPFPAHSTEVVPSSASLPTTSRPMLDLSIGNVPLATRRPVFIRIRQYSVLSVLSTWLVSGLMITDDSILRSILLMHDLATFRSPLLLSAEGRPRPSTDRRHLKRLHGLAGHACEMGSTLHAPSLASAEKRRKICRVTLMRAPSILPRLHKSCY